MHQFDEVRDAQIVDKILFLGMFVKVFVEEISIWISRLSIEDHPHQWGRDNPIHWGPEQNHMAKEE